MYGCRRRAARLWTLLRGQRGYEVTGPARDVVACHCNECRKASGHFTAASAVHGEHLTVVEDLGLRWFRSFSRAQRGFCHLCGSTLFWKPDSDDRISIYAGTIDDDPDLRLTSHIYLDEKGSYYDILEQDDAERFDAGGTALQFPG